VWGYRAGGGWKLSPASITKKIILYRNGEFMVQIHYRTSCTIMTLVTIMLMMSALLTAQTNDLRLRRISLSTTETPVASVLNTLSALSGCNIVISTDVGGGEDDRDMRVTVSLRDVPFEQALTSIVQSVGLSYKFMGENLILVGSKDKMRLEVGERSYIIPLNNISAEKIASTFDAFGGSVAAVPGQNALMVYANPETYADIIARIQEMDIPQQQIEIRVRLIEVSLNDTKRLGIDWSRLNHLTTIIAEDPVNANGIGLPWNYTDETGRLPHGSLQPFERLPEAQYFQRIDGFNNIGHFSRQLTAFDITLDWLLENNAAKILVDTRLTALNGESADMFVGDVIPFVVMDNDKEVQIERAEIGIKLEIRASVNKDGIITATLSPEVSSVVDLVGGFVPRTRERRVNSTIAIPNGFRQTIGGLLSSNLVHTTNKVPFLGDLPFVGRFFQHHYTYIQNTDLIIEITPRVVNIAEEQYEYDIDSRLGNELIRKKTPEEIEQERR
jgi:type IV pilus assembly protein PilQ